MNKNTRLRVSKVILFILLVFVGDFTIGRVMQYMYFHVTSGKYFKLNYVINKTNEDILIFGNSHAECHYVPSVFKDSLLLNCYNAGFRNNDILFASAIHESILNRYSPRLIIFNVDEGMLYANKEEFESYEAKLSDLLPFCKTESGIRKEMESRNSFEKYKLLSGIYPYNSSLINMFKYIISKEDNFIDGYYPIFGIFDQLSESSKKSKFNTRNSYQINGILVGKLINLFEHFKLHNTKIVAVVSPSLYNTGKFDDQLSEIFVRHGVILFDYSVDTNFVNKSSLFSDIHHLNDTGAHLFSSLVAHDIKPFLTKPN